MAVKDWSTTAASNVTDNGPSGGTGIQGSNNISNFDNAVRSIMAQIASQLGKMGFKGADIASAATTNLANATGFYVDITGTTTITALGTVDAGQVFILKFEGILTFTHNGTSLILPGAANITTAVGDVAIMMSEGSGNWRCLHYLRANFTPSISRKTVQVASGTSVAFTGIPANVREITVMFDGVSLSSTNNLLVQLGDSNGLQTSNYVSTSAQVGNAAATIGVSSTSGFIVAAGGAAVATSGIMTLVNLDDNNAWMSSHAVRSNATACAVGGGNIIMFAQVDRLSVLATGADTFDAGRVNILYR